MMAFKAIATAVTFGAGVYGGSLLIHYFRLQLDLFFEKFELLQNFIKPFSKELTSRVGNWARRPLPTQLSASMLFSTRTVSLIAALSTALLL